jgi:hypothetical protein
MSEAERIEAKRKREVAGYVPPPPPIEYFRSAVFTPKKD